MSLSSLTFGSSNSANAGSIGKGRVKVIKAEKFVGMDAVCLIGKLIDGAVAKKMKVAGKEASQVISVESKSGDGYCTKQGAQVVLMIEGIFKEEFPAGSEICLVKGAEEAAKCKGKIIIA
ncbi:MAG: hypothetical protein WCW13_04555 [archaeon]|jgi:hypothetical protein